MAQTANEELFDASLRHQVHLRRFSTSQAKKTLRLLEAADRELSAKLRKRLAQLGPRTDFASKRFKALLADVRAARKAVMLKLRGELRADMVELGKSEAEFELKNLERAIPIEVEFAKVDLRQVGSAAAESPFQGQTLKGWVDGLTLADRGRLETAIRLGFTQGESIQNIVKRVAGTKAGGFADGALAMTRRQAEAVVRTAVNHVSNTAREAVWQENDDIIQAMRWTSTLDGRTSSLCRARDSKMVRVGDNPLPKGAEPLEPQDARPPGHISCRSLLIAIIDGESLLGDRPFVRDTRRREDREVDFRKIARQTGKPIQQVRKEWAAANVGTTAAETTYSQWLKRQPAAFQNEVLGAGKAKLFRSGKVELDQFVDASGKELTLEQLKTVEEK
jgi:SPP1 gp7 family putative phage head morphogenesis protein